MISVFEEFVQGDAEVLVSKGSQNPEVLGSETEGCSQVGSSDVVPSSM